MNKKRTICVVSSSRADYNHLHKLMSNIKQSKKLKREYLTCGSRGFAIPKREDIGLSFVAKEVANFKA